MGVPLGFTASTRQVAKSLHEAETTPQQALDLAWEQTQHIGFYHGVLLTGTRSLGDSGTDHRHLGTVSLNPAG